MSGQPIISDELERQIALVDSDAHKEAERLMDRTFGALEKPKRRLYNRLVDLYIDSPEEAKSMKERSISTEEMTGWLGHRHGWGDCLTAVLKILETDYPGLLDSIAEESK